MITSAAGVQHVRKSIRGYRCLRCGSKFPQRKVALRHRCSTPESRGSDDRSSSSDEDAVQFSETRSQRAAPNDENAHPGGADYDFEGGYDHHDEQHEDEQLAASSSSSSSNSDTDDQRGQLREDSDCSSTTDAANEPPGSEASNSDSDSQSDSEASMARRHNSSRQPTGVGQPPRLADLHIKEGWTIREGAEVLYNANAADSPYYPFANYTEAIAFLLIHKHQLSRSVITDMISTFSQGWRGSAEAAAARSESSSIHHFHPQHMPRNAAHFMQRYRRFLPQRLMPMVEQTVQDKEGRDTKVLHFPVSLLLQRLLLSHHSSRLLTQCAQAHTLTAAEARSNMLSSRHLTALPTEPADSRMRSPAHGQSSRRCCFQIVEHIIAAVSKQRIYIGDVVECHMCTPAQQHTGAQSSTGFAVVRAIFWCEQQARLLVTVSDLLLVSKHPQLRRAKQQRPAQPGTVAVYENVDQASERNIQLTSVLRLAIEEVSVQGYVRHTRESAYNEERMFAASSNSNSNGTSSSSSSKRSSTAAALPLEHVDELQVRKPFDLRAADVYHPAAGQMTAAVSLGIHSDKFSVTQMAYTNTPLCATYWQPMLMDSAELRKRSTMLVGGFGSPELHWQTDTAIHVDCVWDLERGVLADVRMPDGTVMQVSYMHACNAFCIHKGHICVHASITCAHMYACIYYMCVHAVGTCVHTDLITHPALYICMHAVHVTYVSSVHNTGCVLASWLGSRHS